LEPSDSLKHEFPRLLDSIQQAMDEQYPDTGDKDWYRKFGLRYHIAGMEIDVLIGVPNVLPIDFLNVSDVEQRQYMSASVSHLATRFMKTRNLLFHDMVRVAKYWRDSYSWPPQSKPKSYLLEVVMLEACRRCRLSTAYLSSSYGNTTDILIEFFDLLGCVDTDYTKYNYTKNDLPPLFVCFEKYYSKSDLPLDQAEPLFELNRRVGKGRNARIKTRKAGAIVVDPVNPTNNLWLTLAEATSLITRARQTAKQLREYQ